LASSPQTVKQQLHALVLGKQEKMERRKMGKDSASERNASENRIISAE